VHTPFLLAAVSLSLVSCFAMIGSSPARAAQVVYLASPAPNGKGGIFVARLDAQTGKLGELTRAADAPSSFMAMHPNGKLLYSVGQVQGQPAGVVRAFAIDGATRMLTLLGEESSAGRGPCHLAVDPSGKSLIAVNYGGGSFCVLPIDSDGKLRPASATVQHEGKGPHPKRQAEPHPHSINFAPGDGKVALIADLGTDKIMLYDLDAAAGTVKPHDPPHASAPAGAGPRHLDFSPDGRFAYVSDEMTDAVTAYAWDAAEGSLAEVQTISSLPDGYPAADADKNTTSEVQVHPSGKFVYVANRGHNSIAAFAVDPASGKLTAKERTPVEGKVPRHFGIDPNGKWMLVANQASNNVTVFAIDATTGALTYTGTSVEIAQPMCVLFAQD
jgi:6-phosphogluconolactonase